MALLETLPKLDPEPEVELIRWFTEPLDNAVAAARTCYSSKVVYPGDVSKDERARRLRDEIARSTYEAGHHTTIQHPTFEFVLKKVSRQFIWSFLHAHPFYNSEQVSQRYVEVKAGNYVTPPLEEAARAAFEACCERQFAAYRELIDVVTPEVRERFFAIYKGRRGDAEKWEPAVKKRALEIARYVLPVATHAHLYHTISGVTLHRYHRLCETYDAPLEARAVVRKMVAAVEAVDPLFLRDREDPLPLEATPEFRFFEGVRGGERSIAAGAARAFVDEFDRDLGPLRSKLVDWKANAERTVAQAVRTVLGAEEARLDDAAALELALDPARNAHLGSALNVTTLSKLSRALHHAHYTFRKKLSHTADSQDQRHRMTPGSRPILAAHYVPGRPDFVAPQVVAEMPRAMDVFGRAMEDTWRAIDGLLERGVPAERALYLLPNAFPVRFEESGDLLFQHHKWTTRLCYLAQEEIWRASKEEVEQVARVHPRLARHVLAPCGMRKEAGKKPFCPEGKRFCGVPVWGAKVEEYERTL
ncbi:MAG TPA: FAD-dependent thymidylate synthase [Planctomycetota bacterium]|nr:FAD-dependent thymidylate synthase [Planctomycetota bacterium]